MFLSHGWLQCFIKVDLALNTKEARHNIIPDNSLTKWAIMSVYGGYPSLLPLIVILQRGMRGQVLAFGIFCALLRDGESTLVCPENEFRESKLRSKAPEFIVLLSNH